MKRSNDQNAFIRFINGKGFYIVLLACIVCVGVSGLVIVNNTGLFNASIVREEEIDTQRLPTMPPSTAAPAVEPTKLPVVTALPTKTPEPDIKTDAPAVIATATPAPNTAKKVLYVKPVSGTIINKYDDEELVFSQTMGDWRCHLGVDVAANVGTQVKACADGQVCDVGYDELKGFVVTIKHTDEIYSIYCNLSSQILVEIGAQVKAGDVIGGVGDSAVFEELSQPHLHFEMVKGGVNVAPCNYISGY